MKEKGFQDNDIDLGVHMAELPPVKMDLNEIEESANNYNKKGNFEFDISSVEHNPNKLIKKK